MERKRGKYHNPIPGHALVAMPLMLQRIDAGNQIGRDFYASLLGGAKN